MKRLIGITLAMTLLISLLTACNSQNSDTSVDRRNDRNSTTENSSNSVDRRSDRSSTSVEDNNDSVDRRGDRNSTSVEDNNDSIDRRSDRNSTSVEDSNVSVDRRSDRSSASVEHSNDRNISVKYMKGRDFSDGVVWVQPKPENESERVPMDGERPPNEMGTSSSNSGLKLTPPSRYIGQWQCVDKTGKIILKLNAEEAPLSDFSNGVAIVAREKDGIVMIDKTGKVISSPVLGNYDEILYFIEEIGVIIVSKYINTFQLTEMQYGAIDSSGDWVVPLSGDNMLGYTWEYIGDGFIRIVNHRYALLNVLTGELVNPEYDTTIYDLVQITAIHNIDNGFGVWDPYYSSNGTSRKVSLYSIDSSWNTVEIIQDVQFTVNSARGRVMADYAEGLFYVYNKHGFYDIDGNLVIDLSEYNLQFSTPPVFSGGYCLLELKNDQYSCFFTLINKAGEFMFEPKPYTGYVKHDAGSIILFDLNENENYRNRYNVSMLDAFGNTVVELGTHNDFGAFEFHEDCIMVSVRSDDIETEVNYMGIIPSEIYYMDKAGQRLF